MSVLYYIMSIIGYRLAWIWYIICNRCVLFHMCCYVLLWKNKTKQKAYEKEQHKENELKQEEHDDIVH